MSLRYPTGTESRNGNPQGWDTVGTGKMSEPLDDLFPVTRKPRARARKYFWLDQNWKVISRHHTRLDAMKHIPAGDGEYDLCERRRMVNYAISTVNRINGKTYWGDRETEFTVDKNGLVNTVEK